MESSSGAVRTACDIQTDGRWGGREAQTNMKETDGERLLTVDPQERNTWRSGVRSAMRAARQLPGRGAH